MLAHCPVWDLFKALIAAPNRRREDRENSALGPRSRGAWEVVCRRGSLCVLHYTGSLVLLGVGWNWLFVATTTLLTTAYLPAERFRVQALNEFVTFSAQAVASLLAATALFALGWVGLNLLMLRVLALMFGVLLWVPVDLPRVPPR